MNPFDSFKTNLDKVLNDPNLDTFLKGSEDLTLLNRINILLESDENVLFFTKSIFTSHPIISHTLKLIAQNSFVNYSKNLLKKNMNTSLQQIVSFNNLNDVNSPSPDDNDFISTSQSVQEPVSRSLMINTLCQSFFSNNSEEKSYFFNEIIMHLIDQQRFYVIQQLLDFHVENMFAFLQYSSITNLIVFLLAYAQNIQNYILCLFNNLEDILVQQSVQMILESLLKQDETLFNTVTPIILSLNDKLIMFKLKTLEICIKWKQDNQFQDELINYIVEKIKSSQQSNIILASLKCYKGIIEQIQNFNEKQHISMLILMLQSVQYYESNLNKETIDFLLNQKLNNAQIFFVKIIDGILEQELQNGQHNLLSKNAEWKKYIQTQYKIIKQRQSYDQYNVSSPEYVLNKYYVDFSGTNNNIQQHFTEQKKKKIVLLKIKSRAKSAIDSNRINKKNVSKSGEKTKSIIIVPKMSYTPQYEKTNIFKVNSKLPKLEF